MVMLLDEIPAIGMPPMRADFKERFLNEPDIHVPSPRLTVELAVHAFGLTRKLAAWCMYLSDF